MVVWNFLLSVKPKNIIKDHMYGSVKFFKCKKYDSKLKIKYKHINKRLKKNIFPLLVLIINNYKLLYKKLKYPFCHFKKKNHVMDASKHLE